MSKTINLYESIKRMDIETDCVYRLTELYEGCNLDEKKKEELVQYMNNYDVEATNRLLNTAFGEGVALCEDDISDDEARAICGDDYCSYEDNLSFADIDDEPVFVDTRKQSILSGDPRFDVGMDLVEAVDAETQAAIKKLIGMYAEKLDIDDDNGAIRLRITLNDQLPNKEKGHEEILQILKKNGYEVTGELYNRNAWTKEDYSFIDLKVPQKVNESTDTLKVGDKVIVKVNDNKPGVITKVVNDDLFEVEMDDGINPIRLDRFYASDLVLDEGVAAVAGDLIGKGAKDIWQGVKNAASGFKDVGKDIVDTVKHNKTVGKVADAAKAFKGAENTDEYKANYKRLQKNRKARDKRWADKKEAEKAANGGATGKKSGTPANAGKKGATPANKDKKAGTTNNNQNSANDIKPEDLIFVVNGIRYSFDKFKALPPEKRKGARQYTSTGKRIPNAQVAQFLNDSLDRSAQLNEGPGAGYTIESDEYNVKGSVKTMNITDENEEFGEFRVSGSCDLRGTVSHVSAQSYYYGTALEDCDIAISRYTIYMHEVDGLTKEEVRDILVEQLARASYRFVYGGGWSHSEFDGSLTDGDYLSDTEYDIAANIMLTNYGDIRFIDEAVQGLDEDDAIEFAEVDSKLVMDSDGFQTDYTWYKTSDNNNIFIFGDRDIYGPENTESDWETYDHSEAQEWFDSYNGFEDDVDESLTEESAVVSKPNRVDNVQTHKGSFSGVIAKHWNELTDLFNSYMSAKEIVDKLQDWVDAEGLTGKNASYADSTLRKMRAERDVSRLASHIYNIYLKAESEDNASIDAKMNKRKYGESLSEDFRKDIDLDRLVSDVAILLDTDVLGDNWIEVFPVGGDGMRFLRIEITGAGDETKKAIFLNRGDAVEVQFRNGSEAKCYSAEEIARFIAGEFGITLQESLVDETSKEWEHKDKEGRIGRIRQSDGKGHRKPLTRDQAKEIANFRGHEDDELYPVNESDESEEGLYNIFLNGKQVKKSADSEDVSSLLRSLSDAELGNVKITKDNLHHTINGYMNKSDNVTLVYVNKEKERRSIDRDQYNESKFIKEDRAALKEDLTLKTIEEKHVYLSTPEGKANIHVMLTCESFEDEVQYGIDIDWGSAKNLSYEISKAIWKYSYGNDRYIHIGENRVEIPIEGFIESRCCWYDEDFDVIEELYDNIVDALMNIDVDELDESKSIEEDYRSDNGLDDILNWLQDHKQAWNDFCAYFEEVEDEDLTQDMVIDWISEHDQLYNDFLMYFDSADDINESNSMNTNDPKAWPDDKELTYEEALALAKAYYTQGGDGFYETADKDYFDYLVKEFGPQTVKTMKQSFGTFDSVANDRMSEGFGDDHPYTYNEIYSELKDETDNFTIKGDTFKYWYKSEAEAAVKVLEQHYALVELDKWGSWFAVEFKDKLSDNSESTED